MKKHRYVSEETQLKRLSSVYSVSAIWVLQIFLSLRDMLFCAMVIYARLIEIPVVFLYRLESIF